VNRQADRSGYAALAAVAAYDGGEDACARAARAGRGSAADEQVGRDGRVRDGTRGPLGRCSPFCARRSQPAKRPARVRCTTDIAAALETVVAGVRVHDSCRVQGLGRVRWLLAGFVTHEFDHRASTRDRAKCGGQSPCYDARRHHRRPSSAARRARQRPPTRTRAVGAAGAVRGIRREPAAVRQPRQHFVRAVGCADADCAAVRYRR
jgi:hypothetical protein